jgi:nicotinamide riboside transporter PnuC
MIPVWWSVLLTVVGVTGLWIAGRRSAWGWVVGLAAQVLWIAYAIATRQWGFIGSALAYGFVYGRNAHRWRSERAA